MGDEIKLLSGLKVVDLGVGMAPALVAKYLADAGAHVHRIEPPGGDPFYDYYPAYSSWRAKGHAANSSDLDELIANADVCILGGEDHPDLTRRSSSELLAKGHSSLVVLDIMADPWDSGRPTTDILAQARSGLVWEQFTDRPIVMSFHPASYGAALQGLCGLLAALYEREGSGQGQLVRISLIEGAVAWLGMYWNELERLTPQAVQVSPMNPVPLIFRCRDGVYVHFVLGGSGSKYRLYRVLQIDDPSVQPTDSGMPKAGSDVRNFYGHIDLLAAHVARRDSTELLQALWAEGLPAERVEMAGAAWDHPQSFHNGLIHTDHRGRRNVAFPSIVRTTPATASVPVKTGRRPLEGVRVIDFGAYFAGPFASAILVDLGADVIKVEPMEGEPSRGLIRGYMTANRGKRGIALDLKSEEGRKVAHALSVSADVVTNNFRPGVSARLGIDPASLHALKPELIVLESPAYGVTGPAAQKAGFDMVMQALCGHELNGGAEGKHPLWNRTAMVDTTGGMLGAATILAALYHRVKSGESASLQVPLFNAGVFLTSELVQEPDGAWRGRSALNKDLTGYAPNEALYSSKDGWLAIVARGRKAVHGLLDTLDLAADVSASSVSTWGETERAKISNAVAKRDSTELATALRGAGVWVEVCRRDGKEMFLYDASLEQRGAVRITRHSVFGNIREIGPLYSFSRSQVAPPRPLNALGEHTREVLEELGTSPEEIEHLVSNKVVRSP